MTDAFSMVAAMRQKSAERREAEHQAYLAKAAENRRLMPQVTQWVDEMREAFGDVSVAYASEGGRTIGKKSEDGVKLSETTIRGDAFVEKKSAKKA